MKHILRNFWITITRFRMASLLNVVGLSVAYAAFMVVMMQIVYQFGFDKQHADSERIYRINSCSTDQSVGIVSRGVFEYIDANLPICDQATMTCHNWGSKTHLVVNKNGSQVGFSEFVNRAWGNFPQFFGLTLVDGDFSKFSEPGSLIMPRSVAEKIYGTPYVADSTVLYGGGEQYVIRAVYEDIAANSQLANVVYSIFPEELHKGDWGATNYSCFTKIAAGVSAAQLDAELRKIETFERSGWVNHLSASALEEIYFDPVIFYGDESLTKKGDMNVAMLFLAVGLLVICIAVVNFINFSTSLAPLRIKSINIQRVLGNPTSTLRTMLVGEAVLISFLSFLFAIWWVYGLTVSPWRDITEAGIAFSGNWTIVAATGVLSILIGFLAGIYPAIYSTRFTPALVLKGSFAMSRSGRMLRTALVGLQFVVSIGLIISALFLDEQNRYMRNLDKGYKSDQVAVVELNSVLYIDRAALETKLKANSSIQDVAYSQFRLGRDNMVQGWNRTFEAGGDEVGFSAIVVSWNFPQVIGMKFTSGAPMREEEKNNKQIDMHLIVNDQLLRKIGEPVGLRFDVKDSTYSVIHSAVADFNFKTLRQATEPTALVVSDLNWVVGDMPFAYVKFSGDASQVLPAIADICKQMDPTYPVVVELFDDGFDVMYHSDLKTTNLISFFSLLAIIISLVGVFGLIVFETQYRRKEIGVRRVMGSTVGQILVMFNRKFAVIVGVCFVVASGAAYFVVDGWLDGFAYRVPMHWWIFALGGVVVFAVTLIIVTALVYRTTTVNPVKSLKSE